MLPSKSRSVPNYFFCAFLVTQHLNCYTHMLLGPICNASIQYFLVVVLTCFHLCFQLTRDHEEFHTIVYTEALCGMQVERCCLRSLLLLGLPNYTPYASFVQLECFHTSFYFFKVLLSFYHHCNIPHTSILCYTYFFGLGSLLLQFMLLPFCVFWHPSNLTKAPCML